MHRQIGHEAPCHACWDVDRPGLRVARDRSRHRRLGGARSHPVRRHARRAARERYPSPESTERLAPTPAPVAGARGDRNPAAAGAPSAALPVRRRRDSARPGRRLDPGRRGHGPAPAGRLRPPDLVPTETAGIEGGGKVRKTVVADLRAMAAQAVADGIPLRIRSAYRSEARQADVFKGWARQAGRKKALRVSARPGHSEHQLGTTIDFARSSAPPWDGNFGATPTGRWLVRNAADFGFVMSYPKGASRSPATRPSRGTSADRA